MLHGLLPISLVCSCCLESHRHLIGAVRKNVADICTSQIWKLEILHPSSSILNFILHSGLSRTLSHSSFEFSAVSGIHFSWLSISSQSCLSLSASSSGRNVSPWEVKFIVCLYWHCFFVELCRSCTLTSCLMALRSSSSTLRRNASLSFAKLMTEVSSYILASFSQEAHILDSRSELSNPILPRDSLPSSFVDRQR